MEYFSKVLKKTGWSSVIESLIFAILGIVLIVKPETTVSFVFITLGSIFILIGGYKIINYFVNKENYNLYNYDLAFGIIAIIFGIITIAYRNPIVNIFRIIIGLWIIYSSIIRINFALKFKVLESNMWGYSLLIAIIMLVCGIYTVFNSGAIIVTIGIIILIYSILDFIESLFFLVNINKISNINRFK